nr:hypothetical protein [uncultured bacterium]
MPLMQTKRPTLCWVETAPQSSPIRQEIEDSRWNADVLDSPNDHIRRSFFWT